MRRALSGAAALAALLLAGCSTGDRVFSDNGTLTMQVLDSTLVGQLAEEPGNQITTWTITVAETDLPGFGTYSFLGTTPCELVQNVLLGSSLTATCEGSGLVLRPGTTLAADEVRLTVTAMTVTRGGRPEPVDAEDFDGDGVDDDADNCPYLANPGQEDDDCTLSNGSADRDGDTVPDGLDNCPFHNQRPDPTKATDQTDTNQNGIGDVCEESATVTLPAGGLALLRQDQTFTIRDGAQTTLLWDFKGATSLTCDAAFDTCTLAEDEVILTPIP